jgi:hypothetical protein
MDKTSHDKSRSAYIVDEQPSRDGSKFGSFVMPSGTTVHCSISREVFNHAVDAVRPCLREAYESGCAEDRARMKMTPSG